MPQPIGMSDASLAEPRAVAAAAPVALSFDRVTCRFPTRQGRGESYVALRDISLTVGDGEFVSIVGPTGSGKSTLLNLAAGLLRPSEGRVTAFGQPIDGPNRRAGYLSQADALFPWATALDNVTAGLRFRGVSPAEAKARGEDWLVRTGLRGFGDRYPHQMSGGMRKRVALAQTLILDPDIILMDEPFSALDIQTRQLMENELLELWAARRRSVLFITHDLEEAISLSDRVLLLSAGPAAHVIGEYPIDLPRPRDVAEIRLTPAFLDLHRRIWADLKAQVMTAYGQARHG
ncbi:ABC transporter ATP-binding protein [Aliidongia dinghuensis]|uniref:ABC transporter ATP-binding protein n=1 Tax=Aliidongia dinghuensis TaxID=1867774 RepID=A0A8J3E2A7_9PROT|nr:ABC transporter ATP-binding protein [Aliidongia dinghuensis]GGF09447.1 ABC transporter ATP-binding protein [Aliidongia dinghuensis]